MAACWRRSTSSWTRGAWMIPTGFSPRIHPPAPKQPAAAQLSLHSPPASPAAPTCRDGAQPPRKTTDPPWAAPPKWLLSFMSLTRGLVLCFTPRRPIPNHDPSQSPHPQPQRLLPRQDSLRRGMPRLGSTLPAVMQALLVLTCGANADNASQTCCPCYAPMFPLPPFNAPAK